MARQRQITNYFPRRTIPYYAAKGIYKSRNKIASGISRIYKDMTSRKEGPSSLSAPGITTFQHDTKVTYKRRKAPRRVKRRAMRSMKVFQKHMSNLLGCKRFVDNAFDSFTIPANGQGNFSQAFMDTFDVQKVFGLYSRDTDPTSPTYNFNTSEALELLFRSLRCEIEIKNAGTSLQFVDLYYWYPRKDCGVGIGSFLSADSFGTGTGNNNTGTFNTSNVVTLSGTLSTNTLGVTPFDYPGFTENFVVYKVRRVMLQAGQSFSFDLKSRPGNQSSKDWKGMVYRRGISNGVLIFSQGEVNTTGSGTAAGTLTLHKQLFATLAKQGGRGPVSQTYVGTGLP